MSLKSATIVLVGLCNEEPLLQTLIGTIVFRKDDSGQLEPRLINIRTGETDGTGSNPFRPKWNWRSQGSYSLSFNDVHIVLDIANSSYRFSTGTHYDTGSSGTISNGGPELVLALDMLFKSV